MSSERSPRPLIAIVVVSTAFLAGMAIRGLLAGSTSSSAEHATQSGPNARRADGAGPTSSRDGIPRGFERSEMGARAAAVSFVLTGHILLDLPPTQVDEAVRAMAASASADGQVADAQKQLEQLRTELAPGTGATRYLQAVLATRVDAFTPERARLSVWSVGVLSRVGVAAPQAGWTVSVFELVWERSDWKVWSETITPGPAPALSAGAAPATAEELEGSLNGFTPWESKS